MKFRHKLYRRAAIRAGAKYVRFDDYELETTDKEVQETLKANPNVERVDGKKEKESESDD